MREYRRKLIEKPRGKLSRGADGRIRPAGWSENQIADIWAEQRRIRLAQAIDADKRKQQRKQRGWTTSVRETLGSARAKVSTPKVRLPKRLTIGVSLLLAVALAGAFWRPHFKQPATEGSSKTVTDVRGAASNEKPDYQTLLPVGKTIDELGGWVRVSPTESDPVFAFVDTVGGVQLNVSQQPLPEAFQRDLDGQLAKVAKDFSANHTISVADVTLYLGTSQQGPQSAIFAKHDLLVLIKSAQKLSDEQWMKYVASLQ